MRDFEAEGLKCAIRKGPMGHLCGYVAVPESHPWHGKSYSDSVKVPHEIIDRPVDIDKVGAINLLCAVGNSDAMEEGWIDLVLAIDVHGGLTYSSDHEPLGKPDGLWWFGFDCAHAGDSVPSYPTEDRGDVYRDEDYVIAECKSLAKQLSEILEREL